eukprot:jgi/Mesvir1/5509/Mv15550-RA.1
MPSMGSVARCVLALHVFWVAVQALSPVATNYPASLTHQLLQADTDPLATKDTFAGLGEAEKHIWGRERLGSLRHKAMALRDMSVQAGVEIKLVGFDGNGNKGLKLKESDFARYIDALRSQVVTQAVNTEERKGSSSELQELLVHSRFVYHVSHASSALTSELMGAIDRAVRAAPNSTEYMSADATPVPMARIPYSVVDAVLAADTAHSKLLYTVYILSLPPPVTPYAYGHDERSGDGATACLGNTWMSQKERYLWVDLTAGPLDFGFSLLGPGAVTPKSIPRLDNYLPKKLASAIIPDLLAMVNEAALYLLAPSLERYPTWYWDTTEVRLIRILGDVDGVGPGGRAAGQGQGVGGRDAKWDGVNWPDIQDELRSLLLTGQRLEFTSYSVALADCDYCVAAFSRALRTYSVKMAEGVIAHSYLDSEELHLWLEKFRHEIMEEVGVPQTRENERAEKWVYDSPLNVRSERRRVLLVYLWDLTHLAGFLPNRVMLDTQKMALSFPQMVIAVHSNTHDKNVFFACNGKRIAVNPGDVTRPVLASLLRAGWGVASTHRRWGVLQNATLQNYLWATGLTPFGPLSPATRLSFVQRDAAMRNVILSHLSHQISEMGDLLTKFAAYGPEQTTLSVARLQHFTQRFHVMHHKLASATYQLSQLNFNLALYYVRSATHDHVAIENILRAAAAELRPEFSCFTEPPVPYFQYLMLTLAAVAFVILFLYKDRLFQSKQKRF